MLLQDARFNWTLSLIAGLGLALFAGCAGRPSLLPNSDKDLRKTSAAFAADAAKRVDEALAVTTAKMQVLKDTSDKGEAYDQMIGPDNAAGNAIVQAAIDGLVGQTRAVEAVVAALGLKIQVEGSDSLDNPAAVTAE